jgi:ribosomal protein L21
MKAVVDIGGCQELVEVGNVVSVDSKNLYPDQDFELPVIAIFDEQGKIIEAVDKYKVVAKVMHAVGPLKVRGFVYKKKTRSRKRYGHRQYYWQSQVTEIAKVG